MFQSASDSNISRLFHAAFLDFVTSESHPKVVCLHCFPDRQRSILIWRYEEDCVGIQLLSLTS